MEIPFNSEFIVHTANVENAKNALKKNPESSHALQEVTQDFEAVLLNMVLKSMWKTIPKSGLFEKNSATQIYEGLMHSSLSEEMARNGGIGLAKMLYQQLKQRQ